MRVGFLFIGVGVYGLYRFSHAAGEETQLPPAPASPTSAETELRVKISALQKENEELQARLRVFENKKKAADAVEVPLERLPRETTKTAPVKSAPPAAPARQMPVAVKVPPPPALVDWAGSTLLEEMIELSTGMESKPVAVLEKEAPGGAGLNEKQRAAIIAVLRKYSGRQIAIQSVADDDASFEFALSLKKAFMEARWEVDGVDRVAHVNPPAGLLITSGKSSPPEETIIPHEALATAGLDVYRGVDSNLKSQKTVLLVGVGVK